MKTQHALILAAGEGKRLRPLTDLMPKCMAEVRGQGILANALTVFASSGVNATRIVVGHLASVVRERIGTTFRGMSIDYVENADYAKTNSMYSLHLGLAGLPGATWVLEGDVFLEAAVLARPAAAPISWFVDAARKDLDGAYIQFDDSGRALSLDIIRDLTKLSGRRGKSIGLLHLRADGADYVRRWLVEGVAAGQANLYYDLILGPRFDECLVEVVDVGGLKWFEIDNHADLENAGRVFA